MLNPFKDQQTDTHSPSIKNRGIDALTFTIEIGSAYVIGHPLQQIV